MEIGAIFFLLALVIMVGLYLYAPFMSRSRRTSAGENAEVSALMAERDRLINALQELDFDYSLGKIPEQDYPAQRAELLQKGANILRQLDASADSPSSNEGLAVMESLIEKEVAARRADAPKYAAPASDDEIESMLAARRSQRKQKSAGFCPKCGKPVLASDQFCPSCGKSLK